MLSGGDLDAREDLALLLLERRPVLMNGNRSFIIEDLGVSTSGCEVNEAWLGVSDGCCFESKGIDPGLLSIFFCTCSLFGGVLAGLTSLNLFVCSCDFSRTGVKIGAETLELVVGVDTLVVS